MEKWQGSAFASNKVNKHADKHQIDSNNTHTNLARCMFMNVSEHSSRTLAQSNALGKAITNTTSKQGMSFVYYTLGLCIVMALEVFKVN